MLYLIGLGLGSFSDLTIKGLDVLKKCDYVYLDSYTSIFSEENINELKITEKCIFPADREFVEQSSEILDRAKEYDVAFLVIGDPLGATTHSDIILRAVERSIPYQIIHNASVITAVGCCGLHLYNFGITVSIPLWDEFGRPESFVDKILKNMRNGFHTLCLLDIKVKERSLENILRDRNIFEPPRFMTCCEAVYQIVEALNNKTDDLLDGSNSLVASCVVISLSRIGSDDQKIIVSRISDVYKAQANLNNPEVIFGGPPHCIIVPGKIHLLESEFLLARYQNKVENQSYLPKFYTFDLEESDDVLQTFQNLVDTHNKTIHSIQLPQSPG
uniref:diphthine methyl ester synthase n=1 Tax=Trichobilharzia regenti TaxID=157069 RepID=A0AA85JJ15_TRIRE|nr:unnamed protein product [Trichobilharzia regenti]